ncbi:MAG TPA: NADPH-dependent FMN reductase [Mizugakiibacter sp.]
MDDTPLNVLGIAGSLRRASYNRALLRAAIELAPPQLRITPFDGLREIPLYDGDVDAAGAAAPAQRLKDAIAAADALLIVTPEYNYSIPGVLKNAIDWASRPADKTPLRDKPTGIIGASMGNFGTVRAQLALRQVFVFTGTPVMLKPEVLVTRAQDKFDAGGTLTDAPTREHLGKYLLAFAEWSRRCLRAAAA